MVAENNHTSNAVLFLLHKFTTSLKPTSRNSRQFPLPMCCLLTVGSAYSQEPLPAPSARSCRQPALIKCACEGLGGGLDPHKPQDPIRHQPLPPPPSDSSAGAWVRGGPEGTGGLGRSLGGKTAGGAPPHRRRAARLPDDGEGGGLNVLSCKNSGVILNSGQKNSHENIE